MTRLARTKLIIAGIVLPIFSLHAQSQTKDIRFVTAASLGYSTFSFPEKLDHDISFPSTNLSLVATQGPWQLSVTGGFTLDDATISEEEDIGTASRQDLDLNIAYQVSNNWAVFVGYKSGKTKMHFIPRDNDEENSAPASNESYAQEGPFVGGSYSWQFEKAGRLSLSLAYASMRATNNFAANTDDDEDDAEQEELEFDDLTGKIKGDLSGLSYGIAWTMPLSSNLLFQTRFKINDYQQDINVDGLKFKDIDEDFTTLHVGLAYVF